MVLDLMLGGDLRFHLDRLVVMPEDYVRYYAAEVSLGLHYLHSLNVVHRDLKPDNILLDEKGHAHLTDFNIATTIVGSKPLTSVAGSFAYIAPEVLLKRGYMASVDWWSLGIVCYELLFGKRPFRGKTNDTLQHAIIHDTLEFPSQHKISHHAIDFVQSLLTRDVNARIGVGKQGFTRLMSHPWFSGLDWEKLEREEIKPPFIPDSKKANFDPTHELEEILLEDNPLKVRKKTKRTYSDKTDSITDQIELNPERQLMEEKFLTYDYSRPEENEQRQKQAEQKHWAQKMNKNTGHSNRKTGGTYKASVLDYLHQKPATPLTAADILKLEELARSSKSPGKDRSNEWRPPSGLLSHGHLDGLPADAMTARDNYILQQGGNPPPSRPPPINPRYNRNNNPYFDSNQARTSSSDESYPMSPSPDNSEYPLIASAAAMAGTEKKKKNIASSIPSPPPPLPPPTVAPPFPPPANLPPPPPSGYPRLPPFHNNN
ncbi:kinase-like domain-containing protein [Sporodiniella umbellata]|nr:kinase-like domain-containing protein [Sporodiniella umbellata]